MSLVFAVIGLAAFVLAVAGYLIDRPSESWINGVHGLVIIAVPICALVALLSNSSHRDRTARARPSLKKEIERLRADQDGARLAALAGERTVKARPDLMLRLLAALSEIDGPAIVEPAIAALSSKSWTVRSRAARVLGERRSRQAVPALGELLQRRPGSVSVIAALVEIRDASALPYLVRAAEQTRLPWRRRTLLGAAQALRTNVGMA